MTNRDLLAFAWIFHAIVCGLITFAVGRSAYKECGWPWRGNYRLRIWRFMVDLPLRWPIAGRWLLTIVLATFTVMMLDIARNATINQILSEKGIEPSNWQVMIRWLPAPFPVWALCRQITRGLTNDEPAKAGYANGAK